MSPVLPPTLKWTTPCLGTLLAMLVLSPSASAQTVAITLAWDENPEPDVAGYRVYKRLDAEAFQGYHAEVVGQTWAEIDGLIPGEKYWFAVTAFNVFGLESGLSEPLPYTVPNPPPPSPDLDSDHDGLSDWFEATYGEGGQLDPRSDDDLDDLPAIGEFAHGLNPNVFDSSGRAPFAEIGVKSFDPPNAPEARYFYMRFAIDPAVAKVVTAIDDPSPPDGSLPAPFVLIRTERSFDLHAWQLGRTEPTSRSELSAGETLEPIDLPAGLEEVILRSRNPASAQHAEFFRLTYEPAPRP